MAVSFDYWRATQRLRTNAEPRAPIRATAQRRAKGAGQGRSWRLPALYLLALAAPALTALALSPAPQPVDAPFLREAIAPDREITRRADADPVRPKGGEAVELRQNCTGSRRAAEAARLAGAGLLAQAAAPCERAATER